MADERLLRIELKNSKPVELLDLTKSLWALGQAYEDYVASEGGITPEGGVKLYIKELRTSSIISLLQELHDQTAFLWEHRDYLSPFLAQFNDLIQFFLSETPATAKREPTRIEAERVAQVFEPVAKDGGSQLILQVQGDLHMPVYTFSAVQANAVQNQVRRFLSPSLPDRLAFQLEPMTLFQVRDDPKSHHGDRGVIERFSAKGVRLYFLSEDAKRAVLSKPENPFHQVFIVDGEVKLAGGRPAIYYIRTVHDAFDRSELG
ncbi:MAG: hypothetical protein AB7P52_02435 [Alphaproteobacteria bacterium]